MPRSRAHLGERLDPVDDLCLLRPEALRILDGAAVQFLVARGVDVRFPGDGLGHGEDFVGHGGKAGGWGGGGYSMRG